MPPSVRTPPTRASAVIVGGGIVGVSIAYHLARSGVRDVVLLDADALGAGSTSKAAGGVRAQFSDALNIELGRRGLDVFENFAALFDQEIDFHQVGYLFLLDSDEALDDFTRSAALQESMGMESRIISPREAQRLSPYISTQGLVGAAFTPRDGHCTPESVVLGYATAARRLGATLVPGCRVTGIDHDGARITSVQTEAGPIATDTVICAAGAWSAAIGAYVGVDLPVEPLRRQVLITEPVPRLADDTPFTIDFATTLYFHREGRGLLMGMSDPLETAGFKLGRDDAWLPGLAAAIARRAPGLSEVGIASGWAGLYETTPDHNALIGEAPDVSRFLYATGFSGHGFLMGPAVGEIVAQLYRGERPSLDIGPFDARRFADAAMRPERHIV